MLLRVVTVSPPGVAATPAATETLGTASAPVSGAAQVQAAAAPLTGQRPVAPGVLNPQTVTPQAAPPTSGPVAPDAVAPATRGDAAAALTSQAPPPATAATPTAAAAPSPATPVPATTAASAMATANATTAAAAGPAATTFSATVVGTSTTGQPILLAGQDLLTVRAAPVETGSTLVLQLAGRQPVAAALPPVLPDALPRTSLPSLPELVNAAQQVGGTAQAAVTAVVPQPGPALAAQMAMFLSALKSGDLRAWIGEPARTALDRAGRGGAVEKVARELKSASDAAKAGAATEASNPAGEWRAQTIPFANAGAIEPVRLFLHQTNPDDSSAERLQAANEPTRFLLDLDLSRLGRVQLDGFAQPPRFDLILRSEQPLSEPVRLELLQLFTDVTSARGLTGSVKFQVAPPIVPTTVTNPPPRPGIVV